MKYSKLEPIKKKGERDMTVISSKDYLKILHMTKTEFAKRCGVSTPTLYAWIKKDKDGIRDYIDEDGVSMKIFDTDPWIKYKDQSEIERQRLQTKVDDLTDEADRSFDRILELTAEVEKLKVQNAALQQTVDLLQDQISVKDQQIHGLLVSLNQQALALPSPKKSWWERRKERKQRVEG